MLVLEPPGKPVPTNWLLSVAQGLRMSPERLLHKRIQFSLLKLASSSSEQRGKLWGQSKGTIFLRVYLCLHYDMGSHSRCGFPCRKDFSPHLVMEGIWIIFCYHSKSFISLQGKTEWGLSLMRWVKQCDWQFLPPWCCSSQVPPQACTHTPAPGTWPQHPLK